MLVNRVMIILLISCKKILCDNVICAINGKKSVNTVDDRFLSMSIDPAALITGININYTSLLLAQHLSPSFVRIAGPSTEFLSYSKETENHNSEMTITASMWQSMNEWFKIANLTPVFAINDNDKVNGAWNPKPFYSLLDLSDKLNINCSWQLGFDSSCKTLSQYKEDLVTLKHIIDTFPSKKEFWKVVGGDISGYVYNVSNARQSLQSLRDQVDYFMYENASLENGKDFPDMSMKTRLLPRENFKIWTTAPKSQQPVTFASSLEWARQIGDTARGGYSVIFRQPRLHEFFVDTPTYWVSLLHKYLMGRKVLDVKFSQEKNAHLHAYSHCTRKQNDFSKVGAITIMAVNNDTTSHTLALRIGTGNIKKIMVQSYILTTVDENSVNTYLNGRKLSMSMLEDNDKLVFSAKLRRARVTKFLSLPLPEKSIAFFVLPAARIPVCINEEYNVNLLLQEIDEDQNVKLENEENDVSYKVPYIPSVESSHEDDLHNFNEIFKQIEEELEADEKYYKKFQLEAEFTTTQPTTPTRKDFKRDTKQNRRLRPRKPLNFEIDNEEMKNFLKEKLRARATERDELLTSEEIDEEVEKIAQKITNSIMKKIPKGFVREIKEPLRDTRDINMELIRTRADHPKPHHLHHRHRNGEHNSVSFPKISSRRNDNTSPLNRQSVLPHSQRDSRISQKFLHRSQSRPYSFRQALHKPYYLKEKRDSNEGIQDALEFMRENNDAAVAKLDDDLFQEENQGLWGTDGFDDFIGQTEGAEDDLDFSFGQPIDYADEDYFEINMYSNDPFMRRKRKTLTKREAQQGNNLIQEKYHYIFGKPVDPSKIHINPRQKEHQLKLLRQRLVRRKKIDDLHKKVRPAVDPSPSEIKVIVDGKKQFLRKKRSALELSLKARYKKYIPNTENLGASGILGLESNQLKRKRSLEVSENEIENTITDNTNKKSDLALKRFKVPKVIPISREEVLNHPITDKALPTPTVPTTKSTETETDSLNNCITNNECLSLILGSSLNPEEFLKPGWVSKMYKKVIDFLAKIQKDVLQAMAN